MYTDLTAQQRELADYMSSLSEDAYCAGWMAGLEYALWEAVLGIRSEYGFLDFDKKHRSRLHRLSDLCSGWIVFDDETGESWISRAEWERRFSGWASEQLSG